MDLTNSTNVPVSLDLKALGRLFEVDLKPLRNANARLLYSLFIDSNEVKYLTTLDIQDKLQVTNLSLHKKEINGWLSGLQMAGLITKEHERGKPTTIDYEGRYTYDLWSLTEKGRSTAKKISILSSEKTSLIRPESYVKDTDFEETGSFRGEDSGEYTNPVMISLLRVVIDSKEAVTLDDLREKISPSSESLMELIFFGSLNDLLKVEIDDSSSIREKIFGFLGISKKRKYLLEVTEKGRQILLSVP
jgi:hypothetical protein